MEDFSNEGYLNMELLRFTTCGSVDDGKSTLIGRLLYDCKSIFEDQMEALEESSKLRGSESVDLAHLTDGLRAEREQGITIDVAYRYFATPKRKFIIADTPGHVQYTRNMVTGASTADLAIVLIDARKSHGVQIQSKRHAFIASLLGIPHLLVAVNKMDLEDYSEERFNEIVKEFTEFSARLNIKDITFVPISALNGDNVVENSEHTPWYKGPTVLHHLETVHIASDRNLVDFRLPVQYVIRPDLNYRGFAGRIDSGIIRKGDAVTVLPSLKSSKVKSIDTFNGSVDEAFASQSITLSLEDEIDCSRGDMIVRTANQAKATQHFEAMVSWMHDTPLNKGGRFLIRHTSREVQGIAMELNYRVNMEDLHRGPAQRFELNDIGKVTFKTASPIFADPYRDNRSTGSFILIDPATKVTVAAGMIRNILDHQKSDERIQRDSSSNVQWQTSLVKQPDREAQNKHRGAVVWLTGLTGSGKSSIAKNVELALHNQGIQTFMLDGANIRHGLSGDLGFSEGDRREHIRRVGEVARLFFEAGMVVLCPFVSPSAIDREFVRGLFPKGSFVEVHLNCDLETCKSRDTNGLYAKAESGEIQDFTGVTSAYEAPTKAELVINTKEQSLEESCQSVIEHVIKITAQK
jgi:bifunctional enzyme CysN/CysC